MTSEDPTDIDRKTTTDEEHFSEILLSETSSQRSPIERNRTETHFELVLPSIETIDKNDQLMLPKLKIKSPKKRKRHLCSSQRIVDQHVKITRVKRSELFELATGISLIQLNTKSTEKRLNIIEEAQLIEDIDLETHRQTNKQTVRRPSGKTNTTRRTRETVSDWKPIVTRVSSNTLPTIRQPIQRDIHVTITRLSTRRNNF